MNIRYLREFLVFQQHLNFTAAAKELFISQPALSNHIASLENELGVPLLKRGSTFTLTSAGRALAVDAPQLLMLHDAIIEKCRDADANGGTLTIARNHGTRSSNEDNFDILLSGFIKEKPGIYIRDVIWDESSAYRTLSSGEADCVAVNYFPPAEDVAKGVKFVAAPNFVNGRFRLWCDKSHPLAKKGSVTWDEIDAVKMAFSIEQRIVSTNARDLCAKLGIKLESRTVPDFGWGYLRALKKDEIMLLDNGFEGYRSFETFPNRVLVSVEGRFSESLLHIAYLEENENRAFRIFLDYIEQQRETPYYTHPEEIC